MTALEHVTSEDLASYAESSMDPADALAIEPHLRDCHRCLREVAEIRNLIDLDGDTVAQPSVAGRLMSIPYPRATPQIAHAATMDLNGEARASARRLAFAETVAARIEPADHGIEGALLDGRYRVERVLGCGGMGKVVLARDVSLGTTRAIKLMLPEGASSELVQRFHQEVTVAQSLPSEHIAQVCGSGTLSSAAGEFPPGTPYIVFEYLEGRDLAQIPPGRLTIAEIVDLTRQTCTALEQAHAHGIIHRDIKRANLFVVRRPDGSHLLKKLAALVASDVDGISFVGTPHPRSVKTLALAEHGDDPLSPTVNAIRTEDYLLTRRLELVGPRTNDPIASGIISFAASDPGQEIVAHTGFIDVRSGSLDKQPQPCSHCSSRYRQQTEDAHRVRVNLRFKAGSVELDDLGQRDQAWLVSPAGVAGLRDRQVYVLGFTDDQGSQDANVKLAKDRAEAVARRLHLAGIAEDHLHTAGFGTAMPVGDNRTSRGQRQNRRVEIWVK